MERLFRACTIVLYHFDVNVVPIYIGPGFRGTYTIRRVMVAEPCLYLAGRRSGRSDAFRKSIYRPMSMEVALIFDCCDARNVSPLKEGEYSEAF